MRHEPGRGELVRAEEQPGDPPVAGDQGDERERGGERGGERAAMAQVQHERRRAESDAECPPAPGPGAQVLPPVQTVETHQDQRQNERATGLGQLAHEDDEAAALHYSGTYLKRSRAFWGRRRSEGPIESKGVGVRRTFFRGGTRG